LQIKRIYIDKSGKKEKTQNIILFLILAVLLSAGSNLASGQALKFPEDDGIHEEADFEAWSIFSHFKTADEKQFGVAVFFFTGEVIGIKASGIYVVIADAQEKKYENYSKIQIPLFSSTTHTEGRLLENYSDNILEREAESGSYNLKIVMDDFSISLQYSPMKEPIDIGQMTVGDESFNRVYAIPRGKVSAKMLYEDEEYELDGIGIFQHQWGDKPEQSALSDIFALHLNDSTDILIYHSDIFPEINTMLISDRNGKNQVLRKFTATADTILSVKSDNDKFKLDWRFGSLKNQFEIKVLPSYNGQEIEMLGLSYWLSRCKVVIERAGGNLTNGIGYVYIGVDEP